MGTICHGKRGYQYASGHHTAAHTDHGMGMLDVFREVVNGKIEGFRIKDEKKLRDVAASIEVMGKPAGRDVALHRPSSASELGLSGAIAHFDRLVVQAIQAVPECDGAALLRAIVRSESERLVPDDTVRVVALAA